MRLVCLAAVGWLLSSTAGAQNPAEDALLVRHGGSLARQAELHSIDLTHGVWRHTEAPVCPAFTHHVFVLYRRSPEFGIRDSFLAILPRGAGSVRIVPLTGTLAPGGWTPEPQPAVARPETAATFNAVWSEELAAAGHPTVFPGLSWGGLAECYLRMSDERPQPADAGALYLPDPIDLSHPIRSLLLRTAAQPAATGSVAVSFDRRGMVTGAAQAGPPALPWNPFHRKPQPVAGVRQP